MRHYAFIYLYGLQVSESGCKMSGERTRARANFDNMILRAGFQLIYDFVSDVGIFKKMLSETLFWWDAQSGLGRVLANTLPAVPNVIFEQEFAQPVQAGKISSSLVGEGHFTDKMLQVGVARNHKSSY